jgi:hypothetical protein
MVALMATLVEVLVAAEVGDKVDRDGVIRATRFEPSTREHPDVDAVLAEMDGAL